MERSRGDGSNSGGSIVPATKSVIPATDVPATNPTGINPTPMTVYEGNFYQPVQAYFHFVQNNLMHLDESNIDHLRQEAEERHSQITEQTVQQLCSDYEHRSLHVQYVCANELAQQPAEADIRHEHLASELSTYMVSRTVAEQETLNPKERSEANAKQKNAANAVALEAEQRANQKISHVAKQYERRYVELKSVKRREAGGGGEEPGIQNQEQEPHTKMWGKILFVQPLEVRHAMF